MFSCEKWSLYHGLFSSCASSDTRPSHASELTYSASGLQANEVCGQHQLEAIREQSLKVVETLLDNKKRQYRLPVSCRLAERRNMPAFPWPLSGFDFHCSGWAYSDSWILEPHFPPMKRPKFLPCTFRKSVTSQLPPSYDRNTSSLEKTSSGKFVGPTGVVVENSDRNTGITEGYCTSDERKPSSDEKRTDSETSGSEVPRGIGSEGCKFRVAASSRCQNASLMASDVIGTIDFNENGDFFATGGIARKIRICSYLKMVGESEEGHGLLDEDNAFSEDDDDDRKMSSRGRRSPPVWDHLYSSVGEICTPGKLGSLKWRPDGSDVIGCGDYDGVVMEWSIEHGHTVSERYEHSGQRVWSLDYCKSTPTLSASSSADGTVRVWSRGIDKSVLVLRPESGNSVCSAEFSPMTDHLIAVASADTNVYLYDLRKSESSLLKLSGHDRAVSYVRFLGKDKLVSASIDSTLKMWDISPLRGVEDDDDQLLVKSGLCDHSDAYLTRTFSAHTNVRHFVGLAIHRGASILACGSETNEVFMYRNSSTVPLINHKFPGKCLGYSDSPGSGNSYVGAVCWREQGDKYSLVAANSEGVVEVLEATTDVEPSL